MTTPTFTGSVLLGAVLFASAFSPAAGAGYEDAVPGDIIAFIGVDSVADLKSDFAGSSWGRFVEDPGFDGVRQMLRAQLDLIAKEAEEETGSNPFDLVDLVTGPAAFVLLDMGEDQPGDEGADKPPVALAFLLGVGDRGEEFVEIVDNFFASGEEEGDVIRSYESVDDFEYSILTAVNDLNAPEVCYGVHGDTFLFTAVDTQWSERAYIETLVLGLDDDLEETLSQTVLYQDSLAASQSSGIKIFYNVHRFVARIMGMAQSNMSEPELQMMEGLGLSSLEAASALFEVAPAGSRWDGNISWDGEGGALSVVNALFGDGPLRTPSLVPDNVLSMSALHLHLLDGLDSALALMKEIDPEQAAQMEAMMQMAFEQPEFDVRTDIFGNLQGEFGWYTAHVEDEMEALPGTEDDPVSFALLIFLNDGKAFETTLDAILRKQGFHAMRKKEEFQGINVYKIPMVIMPGYLSYTIQNDLLIFSLSGEMLKDVLRRHGGGDLPTLEDNEEYSQAISDLGGSDALAIGYSDAAQSVRDMLTSIETALETGQLGDLPINIDVPGRGMDFDLPDPEVADRYFQGASVNVTRIGPTGIQFTSTGP